MLETFTVKDRQRKHEIGELKEGISSAPIKTLLKRTPRHAAAHRQGRGSSAEIARKRGFRTRMELTAMLSVLPAIRYEQAKTVPFQRMAGGKE